MLVSLDNSLSAQLYDFCIVGTGPAGITTALKLAANGKSVLLLEGGGENYSVSSQHFYKGEVIGDVYHQLDDARLRMFGGTSAHWGGWCRTLDAEDFEAKEVAPITHWPISRSELDPYLKEASSILEIADFPPDELFGKSGLEIIHFTYSRQPNSTSYDRSYGKGVYFGHKYKDIIFQSNNIHLALNANVTHVNTSDGVTRSVQVMTNDGRSMRLRAKHYVLATGGIENSRLLLWSNEKNNGETVKNSQTLGKYWFEHPHYSLGDTFLFGPHSLARETSDWVNFSPTKETMTRNRTLNCSVQFRYGLDRESTKKMIGDVACVVPSFGKWIADMFERRLVCGVRVFSTWEQEPVSTNRVELSNSEMDRLGVPRVRLYWKKNATDLRTARKTAETLGKYLAEQNIGRIRLWDWVLNNEGYPDNDYITVCHLMGGTRMAESPEYGIVDRNCRVFGQENLWIAGSSVFPSGGHANPTLSIVQLALRLAEHLKNRAD